MTGSTQRSAARKLACFSLLLTAFTVGLAASAPLAFARGLKMSVTPKHAWVGERTCFRFAVTGAKGRPVRGALVRFYSDTARTDRRGRARACITLGWSGRHFAWAYGKSSGARPEQGTTFVRAREHGVGAREEWTYIQIQLTGGDDFLSPGCTANWGESNTGLCTGDTETKSTKPFSQITMDQRWERKPDRTLLRFEVALIPKNFISGWTDNQRGRTGEFYVNDGAWDRSRIAAVVSGTDPQKLAQPGGPLHLVVEDVSSIVQWHAYHVIVWGYVHTSSQTPPPDGTYAGTAPSGTTYTANVSGGQVTSLSSASGCDPARSNDYYFNPQFSWRPPTWRLEAGSGSNESSVTVVGDTNIGDGGLWIDKATFYDETNSTVCREEGAFPLRRSP
jgi:hypothetical protein